MDIHGRQTISDRKFEACSAYYDGQQTSFCLQHAKWYGLENSSPLG